MYIGAKRIGSSYCWPPSTSASTENILNVSLPCVSLVKNHGATAECLTLWFATEKSAMNYDDIPCDQVYSDLAYVCERVLGDSS